MPASATSHAAVRPTKPEACSVDTFFKKHSPSERCIRALLANDAVCVWHAGLQAGVFCAKGSRRATGLQRKNLGSGRDPSGPPVINALDLLGTWECQRLPPRSAWSGPPPPADTSASGQMRRPV